MDHRSLCAPPAALPFALILSLLAAGCGSSGDGTGPVVQPLACDAGQFRLQGALDGQSIDINESSAGGGFTQLNGGDLQTGIGPPDPAAPAT